MPYESEFLMNLFSDFNCFILRVLLIKLKAGFCVHLEPASSCDIIVRFFPKHRFSKKKVLTCLHILRGEEEIPDYRDLIATTIAYEFSDYYLSMRLLLDQLKDEYG